MGNMLVASEIVELGIQIEVNGRDFYNTLIAQARNEKAEKVFAYLATEEEKHIQVFKKILEKVEQYEPPEIYAEEYRDYMKALAGDYVFTRKDMGGAIAKKINSNAEAIEAGIGFEKDSIIFYAGMEKLIPSSDKKIVHELILQEQNHLLQLLELKEQLRSG